MSEDLSLPTKEGLLFVWTAAWWRRLVDGQVLIFRHQLRCFCLRSSSILPNCRINCIILHYIHHISILSSPTYLSQLSHSPPPVRRSPRAVSDRPRLSQSRWWARRTDSWWPRCGTRSRRWWEAPTASTAGCARPDTSSPPIWWSTGDRTAATPTRTDRGSPGQWEEGSRVTRSVGERGRGSPGQWEGPRVTRSVGEDTGSPGQ